MKSNEIIKDIWLKLERKFLPEGAWEGDALTLWRERVIFFLFFFATFFSPIALIPSLILSLIEGLYSVFFLDIMAYLLAVYVLFSKKLSLKHKTWIAFSIFYFLGTLLLFILGFYGGGYIWLFGASVIVGAMIGVKAAGTALLINLITFVLIGIYVAFGAPHWAATTENAVEKWFVMTVNFTLVNILVTLIVSIILNSLKVILSKEQRTASELREKREELMAILKANPDPVLVYDKNNKVQYLNRACALTFGWSLSEVEGKKIPFIPEGQNEITFDFFTNDSNDTSVRFETTRRTKDGSMLDISLSAAPVMGNSGEMIGIVVNMKDITELKKMELNLQQAQKMESIGRLAGGIAHDFNNILFPILGHTEILLQDSSGNEAVHKRLEKIYLGSLRARDLVKQILTFSRQEKRELILMRAQPVVKEALNLIRSSIPPLVEIRQEIYSDCGMIKADPTQIHQIVMNLATNACHAMEDAGGELKVTLKEVILGKSDTYITDVPGGKYLCLMISDTGHGMEKDIIRKIFDPFFTTKQLGKGTGMGLSVVHGIVQNIKGTIKVYSEPHVGTVFYVYIPVKTAHISEELSERAEKILKNGTERILVVDDEEEILLMEKNILERLGYKVTLFNSSIEALNAFSQNPHGYDLVITDMAMPKMAGEKLSLEMIKIRPDIPILLCTGFSETMTKERAKSIGIRDFLFKPVNLNDFSHKIREVLDVQNEPL